MRRSIRLNRVPVSQSLINCKMKPISLGEGCWNISSAEEWMDHFPESVNTQKEIIYLHKASLKIFLTVI